MDSKLYQYIFNADTTNEPHEAPPLKHRSPFVKNTYLDLSSKNLVQFNPYDYSHYSDIRYLYLKNNKLETLSEDIFEVFPHLVWLDLRNNKLKRFPVNVTCAPNLTTILLENNNLQELPLEIGSLKHLKAVLLRGNPLLSPLREVSTQGPVNTVRHLRQLWDQHNGSAVSAHQQGGGDSGRRKSSSYLIPSRGEKGRGGGDAWKLEASASLDEAEKYLQKRKDLEVLKEWRQKYRRSSAVGSKSKAPFEFDERYVTMLNRKDLKNHRLKSPPRRLSKLPKVNVGDEINKIKESLLEIKSSSINIPDNPDEVQKLKQAKEVEICKLTELQRRLESLKMKH